MEVSMVRVTRPFIVSFIPSDQYGGLDCILLINHAYIYCFTEIHWSDKVLFWACLGDLPLDMPRRPEKGFAVQFCVEMLWPFAQLRYPHIGSSQE